MVLAADSLDPVSSLDPVLLAASLGLRATVRQRFVERPDRLVVRLDTDRGPVVLKADPTAGVFRREVVAIETLGGHGLPVPALIAHRGGPPAAMALAWTEGTGLTAASPAPVQREVGALLRRLHSIPVPPQRDMDGWMAGWLNAVLAWWLGEGEAQSSVDQVWVWFHRLQPLLGARERTLTLFDGRAEHFVIDGDRVGGMIDLSEVQPGDPAMDLATLDLSEPGLLAEVLAGYEATAAELAIFDELVPFYRFVRALSVLQWHQHIGERAPEAATLVVAGLAA
jgi:aminoglycoside phosphotransferase (APT) family kinase protein